MDCIIFCAWHSKHWLLCIALNSSYSYNAMGHVIYAIYISIYAMHISTNKGHILFKTCCTHLTKRDNEKKKNITTIVMYRAAITAKNTSECKKRQSCQFAIWTHPRNFKESLKSKVTVLMNRLSSPFHFPLYHGDPLRKCKQKPTLIYLK